MVILGESEHDAAFSNRRGRRFCFSKAESEQPYGKRNSGRIGKNTTPKIGKIGNNLRHIPSESLVTIRGSRVQPTAPKPTHHCRHPQPQQFKGMKHDYANQIFGRIGRNRSAMPAKTHPDANKLPAKRAGLMLNSDIKRIIARGSIVSNA